MMTAIFLAIALPIGVLIFCLAVIDSEMKRLDAAALDRR